MLMNRPRIASELVSTEASEGSRQRHALIRNTEQAVIRYRSTPPPVASSYFPRNASHRAVISRYCPRVFAAVSTCRVVGATSALCIDIAAASMA